MDKSAIIKQFTKTRKENGKLVKYFITNDTYRDEYDSLVGGYNAWRQELKKEPIQLTPGYIRHTVDAARGYIDFGEWLSCPTCKSPHYKYVKDKLQV